MVTWSAPLEFCSHSNWRSRVIQTQPLVRRLAIKQNNPPIRSPRCWAIYPSMVPSPRWLEGAGTVPISSIRGFGLRAWLCCMCGAKHRVMAQQGSAGTGDTSRQDKACCLFVSSPVLLDYGCTCSRSMFKAHMPTLHNMSCRIPQRAKNIMGCLTQLAEWFLQKSSRALILWVTQFSHV